MRLNQHWTHVSKLVIVLAGSICLTAHAGGLARIPDIMPGSSGSVYRLYLQSLKNSDLSLLRNGANRILLPDFEANLGSQRVAQAANGIQRVLSVGARNLDWLKHINQVQNTTLSLSSPGDEKFYPITHPVVYNRQIVLTKFAKLTSELPDPMKKVLLDGAPFTDNVPLPPAEYIKWALKVDSVYQLAARWVSMAPYLSELAQARQNDVRGYYFLQHDSQLNWELTNWNQVTSAKQAQLQNWLEGICYNSLADDSACASELNTDEAQGKLLSYYNKYEATAASLWQSFFTIQQARTDIHWTSATPNTLSFPFVNPNNANVADFLKNNIEAGWQYKNWHLRLNFLPDGEALTHIRFEAGALPHANAIAGNEIVMDANAPLTEWDVRWTIRHEFGHILGFPDCYVEFYDSTHQWMVNYQLDGNNIMCSRTGHVLKLHYDELKRVYYNTSGT